MSSSSLFAPFVAAAVIIENLRVMEGICRRERFSQMNWQDRSAHPPVEPETLFAVACFHDAAVRAVGIDSAFPDIDGVADRGLAQADLRARREPVLP